MSGPSIEELIRGVSSRRGAVRLLRRLGFHEPFVRDAWTRHLPAAVHAALTTGGAVLRAWLIELRDPLEDAVVRDVARAVRALDPSAFQLYLIAGRGYARFAVACDRPDRALRHLVLERSALRASDVDILAEMLPRRG